MAVSKILSEAVGVGFISGNSSGMAANTTTSTFPDGSKIGTASSLGMRNRIINGDFRIWQRGTSFTPSQGVNTYCADRWFARMGAASSTVTQDSSVPSTVGSLFPYSIKVKRNSGDTTTFGNYLAQIIESVNCIDLAGQQVTLSFWAKSGTNYSGSNGNISCFVQTGTVADEGGSAWWNGFTGNATAFNQSVTLTTTWTKYIITGTIGSGVKEVAVNFAYQGAGTAGADDSFYVTGVQLEVGSFATPFERRQYGTELQLCQRYYLNVNSTNEANPIYSYGGMNLHYYFPVTMRASPSCAVTSGSAGVNRTRKSSMTFDPYTGDIYFTANAEL